MSGRESGIRHALDSARRARADLEAGKIGPALSAWGHAGNHLAFTVGLCERSRLSLAAVLLRKALINLGTRLERAVAPRATVPGYEVAGAVSEALAELEDDDGVPGETLTAVAARAAVEIVRRWTVTERE